MRLIFEDTKRVKKVISNTLRLNKSKNSKKTLPTNKDSIIYPIVTLALKNKTALNVFMAVLNESSVKTIHKVSKNGV